MSAGGLRQIRRNRRHRNLASPHRVPYYQTISELGMRLLWPREFGPPWTQNVLERTLVTIAETETIEEAFRRLNANMLGILFAQDAGGRIVGAVTDGDIRRRMLTGTTIQDRVATCIN